MSFLLLCSTVCEGCGERHDEARLLLCDECDISYHIYCMEPPLDYVPQGNCKQTSHFSALGRIFILFSSLFRFKGKCKWCAVCQACGSSDPGLNSTWLNNYSMCGPCASLRNCPVCSAAYGESDLIIQCQQCVRWLHAGCDSIRGEREAEFCAEEGYTCVMCRSPDQPPPHLLPANASALAALVLAGQTPAISAAPTASSLLAAAVKQSSSPTPSSSPIEEPGNKAQLMNGSGGSSRPKSSSSSAAPFVVDGVFLSDTGMNHLRSLQMDQPRRRVRNKNNRNADQDAAEGDGGDEGDANLKDGTILMPREDGRPPDVPDGYTVVQGENGSLILRKKRQRNLQKLGIGGFQVRRPWARVKDKEEDANDTAEVLLKDGASTAATATGPGGQPSLDLDMMNKPKRKPQRRKPKNKLVETYPTYLQEAFFGRDLMQKPAAQMGEGTASSDSEVMEDVPIRTKDVSIIQLSREEVAVLERRSASRASTGSNAGQTTMAAQQQQKLQSQPIHVQPKQQILNPAQQLRKRQEEADEEEALKDVFPLGAGDLLLDSADDLVDSIMKEEAEEEAERVGSKPDPILSHHNAPDELSDILRAMPALPNMDCNDVDDLFKGVLTDESQESQSTDSTSTNHFPVPVGPAVTSVARASAAVGLPIGQQQPGAISSPAVIQQPPPSFSPYLSEYSSSPGFSPAFSEPPPSPWPSAMGGSSSGAVDHDMGDGTGGPSGATANQRNALKWEADEALGLNATISAVLYANTNHPELKRDYAGTPVYFFLLQLASTNYPFILS